MRGCRQKGPAARRRVLPPSRLVRAARRRRSPCGAGRSNDIQADPSTQRARKSVQEPARRRRTGRERQFQTAQDRVGDDLGLVAVDAAGGELLGERRACRTCWQPTRRPRHGRNSPCRLVDSGRPSRAKPIQPDGRFSRCGPGNTGPLQFTECLYLGPTRLSPSHRPGPLAAD